MRLKILLFALLLFVLSQSSCSLPKTYKKSALLMGTFVEIQIVSEKGATEAYLHSVIESAFSEIRKVEKTFSLYDPGSELSRLNEFGIGRPYKVSEEFMFLLKNAIFFFELTEGAFDISMRPLEDIWQNANKLNKIPSEVEIKNGLNLVGMDRVTIDEGGYTIKLQEGMKLDFGAIAKGYAVDMVISSFERSGIENAIVNAGGDIYCLGKGLNKIGWQIGVRHPRKKDAYVTTLLVRDRAVATSGDYERFYTIEEKKFSYIINPATGMPVEERPMSVTVLAGDCLTADALATAIFVLGPERGMELLDRLKEIEGVIISRGADGLEVEKSEGLKEIDIFDEG